MLETTGEYNPSWKNSAGYSDNVIFLLPNQTDNTVGYINLGNIDLSQYKYCAISYGTDVEADFGGSGLKADTPCVFGLTTDGESYGVTDKGTPPIVPGDNTLAYNACVNTSATWNAGTRIMIIDLTNVTYSGEVYVSFSTTTGNGVVVSSIAFYS